MNDRRRQRRPRPVSSAPQRGRRGGRRGPGRAQVEPRPRAPAPRPRPHGFGPSAVHEAGAAGDGRSTRSARAAPRDARDSRDAAVIRGGPTWRAPAHVRRYRSSPVRHGGGGGEAGALVYMYRYMYPPAQYMYRHVYMYPPARVQPGAPRRPVPVVTQAGALAAAWLGLGMGSVSSLSLPGRQVRPGGGERLALAVVRAYALAPCAMHCVASGPSQAHGPRSRREPGSEGEPATGPAGFHPMCGPDRKHTTSLDGVSSIVLVDATDSI